MDALNEFGYNIHTLYLVQESLYNDIDVVIKFIFLIGISWISWSLIESPINAFKKNFEFNVKEGLRQ